MLHDFALSYLSCRLNRLDKEPMSPLCTSILKLFLDEIPILGYADSADLVQMLQNKAVSDQGPHCLLIYQFTKVKIFTRNPKKLQIDAFR